MVAKIQALDMFDAVGKALRSELQDVDFGLRTVSVIKFNGDA